MPLKPNPLSVGLFFCTSTWNLHAHTRGLGLLFARSKGQTFCAPVGVGGGGGRDVLWLHIYHLELGVRRILQLHAAPDLSGNLNLATRRRMPQCKKMSDTLSGPNPCTHVLPAFHLNDLTIFQVVPFESSDETVQLDVIALLQCLLQITAFNIDGQYSNTRRRIAIVHLPFC